MSGIERSRVVFAAGDPGGANVLAPVISRLESKRQISAIVFAYYHAGTIFQHHGIEFVELPNATEDEAINHKLVELRPDLMVSGTSVNPFNLEKLFISAAKKIGIPTLAVLDFWSNYTPRFSRGNLDVNDLPDKIAVMDQLAVAEMVAEGFPADRLVITGQPAFDRLAAISQQYTSQECTQTRNKLGIECDDFLVLFVSQPFAELFGSDASSPEFPGYTQQTIFQAQLKALENIAANTRRSVTLVVLPHLRESQRWWEQMKSDDVEIKIMTVEDFDELALSSNLVTGMTSTKLVEAAILGRVTASLQLGASPSSRFDMTRYGVSKIVYEPSALDAFLENHLLKQDEVKFGVRAVADGQGTVHVLGLMEEMLNINLVGEDN